jgi:hypothetical protein
VDEEQRPEHGWVPAVRPPDYPVPVDPEQLRRFEQFQEYQRFLEFQEYQREHGGLPPATPPAKKRPLYQRVLRSKLFRRLVVLLVLIIAASWAYEHYFGTDDNLPASVTGGGRTTRTVLFATDPKEAVRAFYDNVAQGVLPDACNRLADEKVEQQFANDFGAADCPSAINALHAQVQHRNDYAEVFFPSSLNLTPGADGTVVVSSCALEVNGGPRLGRFTLKVIPGSRGDQWTITAHAPETCT